MARELDIRRLFEQSRNRISNPTIAKAISLQKRLRFHTENNPFVFGAYSNEAVTDYLSWVQKLLPLDKYKVFCELFRTPVKSTALTAKSM